MASKIRTSKKSDLAVLNKLIRKCEAIPAKLCFQTLGDVENWVIIVYTDASLANCEDLTLQCACLLFLANRRTYTSVLISWRSQKSKRAVRGTLSAETVACVEALDSGIL